MDLSGIQLLLDAAAVVSENINNSVNDAYELNAPLLSVPSVGCNVEVACSASQEVSPGDASPEVPAALESGSNNTANDDDLNAPLLAMPSVGCNVEVACSASQEVSPNGASPEVPLDMSAGLESGHNNTANDDDLNAPLMPPVGCKVEVPCRASQEVLPSDASPEVPLDLTAALEPGSNNAANDANHLNAPLLAMPSVGCNEEDAYRASQEVPPSDASPEVPLDLTAALESGSNNTSNNADHLNAPLLAMTSVGCKVEPCRASQEVSPNGASPEVPLDMSAGLESGHNNTANDDDLNAPLMPPVGCKVEVPCRASQEVLPSDASPEVPLDLTAALEPGSNNAANDANHLNAPLLAMPSVGCNEEDAYRASQEVPPSDASPEVPLDLTAALESGSNNTSNNADHLNAPLLAMTSVGCKVEPCRASQEVSPNGASPEVPLDMSAGLESGHNNTANDDDLNAPLMPPVGCKVEVPCRAPQEVLPSDASPEVPLDLTAALESGSNNTSNNADHLNAPLLAMTSVGCKVEPCRASQEVSPSDASPELPLDLTAALESGSNNAANDAYHLNAPLLAMPSVGCNEEDACSVVDCPIDLSDVSSVINDQSIPLVVDVSFGHIITSTPKKVIHLNHEPLDLRFRPPNAQNAMEQGQLAEDLSTKTYRGLQLTSGGMINVDPRRSSDTTGASGIVCSNNTTSQTAAFTGTYHSNPKLTQEPRECASFTSSNVFALSDPSTSVGGLKTVPRFSLSTSHIDLSAGVCPSNTRITEELRGGSIADLNQESISGGGIKTVRSRDPRINQNCRKRPFDRLSNTSHEPSRSLTSNGACPNNPKIAEEITSNEKPIRVDPQYPTTLQSQINDDIENDSECGDIDDADEEVQIGDLTLLNEFSIDEYFEKYQNLSLLLDDEPINNKENEAEVTKDMNGAVPLKSDDANIGSSLRQPLNEVELKDGDMGFEEIDTPVQPKKLKLSKRKIVQNARIRGLEYTQSNGRLVPARTVKPSCTCSKLKCFEKYEDSIRKKLLENLLKLSMSGQNQFLSNHIAIRATARPKVLSSRRQFSRSYFLPGFKGRIRVCKEMFMATFDIKDKKTRLLAEKQLIGRGISADDLRAQNGTHRALSEEHFQYISNHIRSFPAYSSHYCREKSSKLYLSSDLSILKMHYLYKQKCQNDNKQPVHYTTYRRIFKKMNLSFRKPKMDTCGECDKLAIALKLANDSQKAEIEAQRDAHQYRAKEAYRQKKVDVIKSKTTARFRTASFDLQKCLATPHLSTGIAYYKRQLYTLNLTVFSTLNDKNTVDCYLWDESKAKRGSQEIGSCILKDLSSMNPAVEEVVYYSDRCAGQNHNYIICMTFLTFIDQCRTAGRKLKIEHKFMTSGHSHMQVDSVHGAIEMAKKRSSMNIETPRDWAVFIGAIHRQVPFNVHEMEQSEFLSLKSLDQYFNRPKKNCQNEVVKFKDISTFQYCTDNPGMVFYKYDLSDNEYQCFQMRAKDSIPICLPPPITDEPIPLAEEKLQDLRDLMEFVSNKEYYQTLLKQIVPKKRGRRSKSEVQDHFENDLYFEEVFLEADPDVEFDSE